MIFHNAGKYNGDENSLPQREHPEGYVPFKEFKSMKAVSIIANAISLILLCILLVILWLRTGHLVFNLWGIILSIVCLFPHELLHASCFKKDVYMYENLSQGLMFVVGTEDMSKARFIFMSLLPNIVFGLIPFIVCLFFPELEILGTWGAFSLSSGAGDYCNVFFAATQMPKGAKTYLSGMHSYWYMPKEK